MINVFEFYRKHYKEYLICKLNEASVDPADFMDLDELRAVLGREEKELPPKNNPNEGDDDYLKRMREVSFLNYNNCNMVLSSNFLVTVCQERVASGEEGSIKILTLIMHDISYYDLAICLCLL